MAKVKLTTRQRESKKINRKRAVRKWWQTTSRRVIIISVALAVLSFTSGGWWLWHSDKVSQMTANISAKFWQETVILGFKVDNVYLEGRKFTPLYDVTKAMEIKTNEPILNISLSEIKDRLQAIPRVKYAEVARVLPDQLHVHIVEREPVAIWQNEGKLHLIDDNGVVMEYVDPAQYKNLLLVVGEDAPAHTRELLTMMASAPEMYKNVFAVMRVGERRWNVRFRNGIELKLPEKDADAAWQNFAHLEQEDHLLERSIKSVDMRISDRVFIKTNPSEISPVKESGGRET